MQDKAGGRSFYTGQKFLAWHCSENGVSAEAEVRGDGVVGPCQGSWW